MIQKLLLASLSVMVTLGALFTFQPSISQAALFEGAKKQACSGINLEENANCATGSGSTLTTILEVALNILSIVVGLAAVVMIIIGGIKYITSQGEASNTNSAKNTIIYALVGLVIVALAQVIVRFVFTKTT